MHFARVLESDEALAATISACLTQREHRPGQRLPTEREWAVELGLTRHQVRRGLERLVRKGRLLRRRNDGYYVATPRPYRGAKSSTSQRTIGFLASGNYLEYNPMHPMRRLVDRAREANSKIVPLVFDAAKLDDLSVLAHAIENQLYDAFFWMPMASPHVHEVAALFQKYRAPVVCVTEALVCGPTAVTDDYWRVGAEAAGMVASAGHRRVLSITYDDPEVSRRAIGTSFRARLNLEPRVQLEELFVRGWVSQDPNPQLNDALEQSLARFRPTVIFAGSRRLSEILLDFLSARGIGTPQDISFVGYGSLGTGLNRNLDCTSLQSDEDTFVATAMAELERLLQNPFDEVSRQTHVPPVIHLGNTLKQLDENPSPASGQRLLGNEPDA